MSLPLPHQPPHRPRSLNHHRVPVLLISRPASNVPYGVKHPEEGVEEVEEEEEVAEEEEEEDRQVHLISTSLSNPLNKPRM